MSRRHEKTIFKKILEINYLEEKCKWYQLRRKLFYQIVRCSLLWALNQRDVNLKTGTFYKFEKPVKPPKPPQRCL